MTAAIADLAPSRQAAVPWRSFATAEWIKLRTIRSTFITLGVAALVSLGVAVLACERFAAQVTGAHTPADRAHLLLGFDAANQSLVGNAFAQIAIGALGVLVVTGEFATGMVRASLTAMPQRTRWMLTKFAVFGAVALIAGQLLCLASFTIGQAFLAPTHVGLSLSDPGALRAIGATGLYLSLIGLLGAGLGLLIRNTAGAISALVGVIFVLQVPVALLPEPLQGHIARFLPESIGEQAASISQLAERFPTWGGIALMASYVVAVGTVGLVLLNRRDA